MKAHLLIATAVLLPLLTPTAFAQSQFESSKLSPGVVTQGAGLQSSKLSSGVVTQGAGLQSSKISVGVVLQTVVIGGGVIRAPLTHW
jgi:hypothetical protein